MVVAKGNYGLEVGAPKGLGYCSTYGSGHQTLYGAGQSITGGSLRNLLNPCISQGLDILTNCCIEGVHRVGGGTGRDMVT